MNLGGQDKEGKLVLNLDPENTPFDYYAEIRDHIKLIKSFSFALAGKEEGIVTVMVGYESYDKYKMTKEATSQLKAFIDLYIQ